MDIPGTPGASAPAYIKDMDPSLRKDEKNMSLGERLNQMSGVQTQKNLYEDKTKMGKDAFLKMFMEQLKDQDPLNPVKNEQFSQQMAMFSQLEQQITTNQHLEKMVSQQNNTQIAALQLVGKTITADRAAIYHDKDKASSLSFKLPQDLSEVKVEIQDQTGEVVKTYNLGTRNQGDVTWKWDGFKETGQPAEGGRFSYRVSGKGMDGKEVKVSSKVDGRVSGVTSAQGVVFLLVDDQRVGLNDVETIKEMPAGAAILAPKMGVPMNAMPTNSIPLNMGTMRPTAESTADVSAKNDGQNESASQESSHEESPRAADLDKTPTRTAFPQDVTQAERMNPYADRKEGF